MGAVASAYVEAGIEAVVKLKDIEKGPKDLYVYENIDTQENYKDIIKKEEDVLFYPYFDEADEYEALEEYLSTHFEEDIRVKVLRKLKVTDEFSEQFKGFLHSTYIKSGKLYIHLQSLSDNLDIYYDENNSTTRNKNLKNKVKEIISNDNIDTRLYYYFNGSEG